MKWNHLVIASVFGVATMTATVSAQGDLLGKGKKGGGGSSGGGKSSPPPSNQGGGKSNPPPSNQNGGGSSGGHINPPPAQGGGSKGSPPPNQGGGDLMGKGGSKGNPPSNSGGGGQTTPPPRQGGNGDVINKGGSSRSDDNRGGRDSGGRTLPGGGNNNDRQNDGYRPSLIIRQGDDVLQKQKGRTGDTSYGTVNNQQRVRGENKPILIERAPVNPRTGSLEYQVRRQEHVEVRNGRWRSGYYQYDNRWNDDCFSYPYYTFTPVYDRCVVSPWYYYPHLPGYITVNRIQIINVHPWRFSTGTAYNWRRINWYDSSYRYDDADYAVDDLIQAFERRDRRALGRLVPRNGRVSIAVDGQYAYSVEADDFYDMLLDATQSTRTYRYNILNVRTWRDEIEIVAEHQYTDPWGRQSTMYHTYRLERERGGYVIRDFGSSAYRYW